MPYHQQHFHDAFKLCKILHGGKKITAVENKLRKKSDHKTTHTHLF